MTTETYSASQFLLLENDGLVRSGMKGLIQLAEPQARIYEACSYDEAIGIVSSCKIDIAFLDYDLKSDRTGVDVLKYIRDLGHETRVLMLSAEQSKDFVMQCINEGASGYIPKAIDDDGSVFRRALDIALSGGIFLPRFIFSNDPEYSSVSAFNKRQDSLETLNTGVSRFFYEPMIQLSGILDYRDFFLSDKIVLISTLLTVGKKSKYIL